MRSIGLLAILISIVGCGPTSSGTKAGSIESIITIEKRALPKNVLDQSVNKGEVRITTDSQGVPALELSIAEGSNTEGGFNGAGNGNRAIVGFTQFNGMSLASLGPIRIDTGESVESVKLLLLIDLNCDGQTRVLETNLNPGMNALDQYVWNFTDSRQPVRLAEIRNACLRNTDSRDEGLPRLPTAAVLLALGSPSSVVADRVLIRQISIGDLTFDRSTWESK